MDLEIGFIKSVSSNLILYDVHRILGFLTPPPLCPQNLYCLSANLGPFFTSPFCTDVIYGRKTTRTTYGLRRRRRGENGNKPVYYRQFSAISLSFLPSFLRRSDHGRYDFNTNSKINGSFAHLTAAGNAKANILARVVFRGYSCQWSDLKAIVLYTYIG